MKQPQRRTGQLSTYVSNSGAPSLAAATSTARLQRQDSLQSLEKDKHALPRRNDLTKHQFPVMMVFLIAPYESTTIGRYTTKKYKKIEFSGSTVELPLLLTRRHATERDLLQWLFQTLRVTEDQTGGKKPCVDDWRICTNAQRGTQVKAGSWQRPAWKPDAPITLLDYKEMVHEADGKDKDSHRSGWMPGKTARHTRRVLAVFAVSEVVLGEKALYETRAKSPTPPPPPPALETYNDDDDDDDGLFGMQPSRAAAREPTARPVPPQSRLPPVVEEHDQEDTQPWSPPARERERNGHPVLRRGRLPWLPESPTPASAVTESAPSGLEVSAFASPGTVHARPSTAASSVVELSNLDLSSLALARFGASNTYMGHQPSFHQPATPPKREEPSPAGSLDAGDTCVCPANLHVGTPIATSAGPEPTALTPGTGFIEADHEALTNQVVGQKRKLPSPAQAEADGKPKKRGKKKPARRQAESAGGRQSVRIMARSTLK